MDRTKTRARRELLELNRKYRAALAQAKREMHITDESAWGMSAWNADRATPKQRHRLRERLVEDDARPSVCGACGTRRFTWNGRAWYCDTCDTPTYPVIVAVPVDDERFGVTIEFSVSPRDSFYEHTTELFRVPAVTNRPWMLRHARPRPINRPKTSSASGGA